MSWSAVCHFCNCNVFWPEGPLQLSYCTESECSSCWCIKAKPFLEIFKMERWCFSWCLPTHHPSYQTVSCAYHKLIFQRWNWWHPGVFLTKHCDESPGSPSQGSVLPQLPAHHSSPGYASPPSHLVCGLYTWTPNERKITSLKWEITKYRKHTMAKKKFI